MAAKHGLEGIEIFYEDLLDHAVSKFDSDLYAAAASIRQICDSLGQEIICLQPFMHYEGLLDRKRHDERIDEAKVWMKLAKILRTDVIQVPSSFLKRDQISDDVDLIVSDLRELADLGLQQNPVIRFAYESLCWATYIDLWEACWDIVQRVDRSNFGVCLDTFNILGRIYADPTSETRTTPNPEQVVRDSIQRLVEQIKPHREKIFFIQVVDAERLEERLTPSHPFYNADQPSRMSWSRNCRLFYGEQDRGGYLPVKDVAEAIIKTIGYDGWVSMELFNRVMNKTEKDIPEHLAERAGLSWKKLVNDLQIDLEPSQALPDSRSNKRKDSAHEAISKEAEFARL